MTQPDPDKDRGLYPKYQVNKIMRGTDQRGEETETLVPYTKECFVIQESDPYAPATLLRYADSCVKEFPQLAREIRQMAYKWDRNQRDE